MTLATTPPIRLGDTIASSTVLRVVVAHDIGADPTALEITLLREEQRWWPGDDRPEIIDTVLDETVLTLSDPRQLSEALDTWLLREHRLRLQPGSWQHRTSPDLDFYANAIAIQAVPVIQLLNGGHTREHADV